MFSRFLMNAVFAGGGYPWAVVRLSERERYLSALADASDKQNIQPFANLLAQEMNATDATAYNPAGEPKL